MPRLYKGVFIVFLAPPFGPYDELAAHKLLLHNRLEWLTIESGRLRPLLPQIGWWQKIFTS